MCGWNMVKSLLKNVFDENIGAQTRAKEEG